jgi:hypothetical protein
MVAFSRMSVEQLREYNRKAQERTRSRKAGAPDAPPKKAVGRPRSVVEDVDLGPIFSAGTPGARPTQAMIDDAERRSCAPRSLTSLVFGDPPPGRSALDKRRL